MHRVKLSVDQPQVVSLYVTMYVQLDKVDIKVLIVRFV